MAACAERGQLVQVQQASVSGGARLSLVPAAGVRINARLKPVLELTEGGIITFDSPDLTADSSYFTSPPTAMIDRPPHGTIRASVCPPKERVCRRVDIQL